MPVCDTCRDAAEDDGIQAGPAAAAYCRNFGDEMPDHDCEAVDDRKITCGCKCRRTYKGER